MVIKRIGEIACLLVWAFLIAMPALPANANVPFITNYSKSEYRAANQNWSVAEAPNGILYFANSEGLLEFDGSEWRLMRLPNRTIIRSVAVDKNGRIYTGSYQEFGYWEEDARGAFHYTSLSKLLGNYSFNNEEIWKIIIDEERVYFQAFSNQLFLYEKGEVKAIKAPDVTLYSFQVNGQLIVQGVNDGLYILSGDRFHFWKGSELFAGMPVLTMLPIGDNRLLVGTATGGIYLYDGSSFTPWNTEASDFLKRYQLNEGIKSSAGFVFGSIQNGVIIVNEQGRILRHLNRENGLQNNTVLGLHEDQQRNLWLGLDNGIDYVELSGRYGYYRDRQGLLGSVYDAAVFDQRLFLATNHGVFSRSLSAGETSPFDFVKGSHGQTWSLEVTDGSLLCGHNEGTFRIEKGANEFSQVSNITGGWLMREVPGKPDYRVQGTYTGLAIFQRKEGRWTLSHRVDGFTQPLRYLEFDKEGLLWAARAYEGVYRIRLSDDLRSIRKMDYFDKSSGFPSNFNINVFKIGARLVFTTGERIYTYDELEGKIVPFDRLNKDLGALQRAHRILPAGKDRYWFIARETIALVSLEDFQVKEVLRAPFSRFLPQMVSEYQRIVSLNDSTYLFCLDDGFATLQASDLSELSRHEPAPLFIRRFVHLSDSGRLLPFEGGVNPEIPYNKSHIKMVFAAPAYGEARRKFQVMLEGFDQHWQAVSSLNYKEYTNLPAGDYTFKVRLADAWGDEAVIDHFSFSVLPPWYASWWAIVLYILLAIFLIAFFRRRYRKKIQRRHERAMERFLHEKEEQLKEERLLGQQRLVELENEKLQSEIAAKSNELANSTMAIIKKNEVLIGIKEELAKIKKKKNEGLSSSAFNKLIRVVDHNISNDDDWKIFEQSFNRAHEDFFRRLKQLHPDLTPNDLRLCAYLKMNISSKEIAPLLNISVRGVEIRRYRLRKKLNLEHDDNLVEYMMGL